MFRVIYCVLLSIAVLLSGCGKDTPAPERDIDRVKGWMEYSLFEEENILLMTVLLDNASKEVLTVRDVEIYYKSNLFIDYPPGKWDDDIPPHSSSYHVVTLNGMPAMGYDFDVKVFFEMTEKNYVMTVSNHSFKIELASDI